jgi:hypothetical protein
MPAFLLRLRLLGPQAGQRCQRGSGGGTHCGLLGGLVGGVKTRTRALQILVGLGVVGVQQDVAQRLAHLQALCVHILQATGGGLLGGDVVIKLGLGLGKRPDAGAQSGNEQGGWCDESGEEALVEIHGVVEGFGEGIQA